MSTYTDENPVVSFRIPIDQKKLLSAIAKDMKISPQILCQKIVEAWFLDHKFFQLVFKKPEV